jgi:phosphate acyltransferase
LIHPHRIYFCGDVLIRGDKMIKVAVDAMGGDNAPLSVVRGCAMAVRSIPDVYVYAVGKQEEIEKILADEEYDHERLEIVNATETIEMGDVPTLAVRRKKDSSLVVAMRMVHDGMADALVSCGSTGAVLVGAQVIVGRKPGVGRSPLATLIPTAKGFSLLIDCGANVDPKPEYLHTFACLGSEYYSRVMGVERPSVKLVNIGAEDEKGNALVKAARPLLEADETINYAGYIEARDIPAGCADVIVCDAFTGNVILKLYEGLSKTLIGKIKEGLMSSLRAKIGALLIKPALKAVVKSFDAGEYGGAPMLGLTGLVVKGHGNSDAKAVCNAIRQCVNYKGE